MNENNTTQKIISEVGNFFLGLFSTWTSYDLGKRQIQSGFPIDYSNYGKKDNNQITTDGSGNYPSNYGFNLNILLIIGAIVVVFLLLRK